MIHQRTFCCASALLLGISACATTKPVTDSGAALPSSSSSVATKGAVRWTGLLQPMQQQTGALAPTGQTKAFGTVTLISRGEGRMLATISLSTPLQNSASLNWAMLEGRCGSGTLPLIAVERFPMIDVGTNGRGDLNSEMSLALPTSGTYHVNIYWSGTGTQLNNVMTCANLRKE